MRLTALTRALLVAALSTFLCAQDATADLKKVRAQANEAVQSGDYATAAANFKKLTEANPKDAQAWQLLGYALHMDGKLDEALPAHMKAAEFKQTAPVATYNIACVHALKGRADEAFTWLEKCVAAGFADINQLQGDADFDALRKDPRMGKIEAAVKAAAGNAPQMQVFAMTVARKNSRAAWFGKAGSPAQIAIDWSPVAWKDAMGKAVESGKMKGQKWRLGADFWTRLDNSVALQCGSVAVPAGYWYLTLEQRDANTFVLALHDALAVKQQKLDAFQANKLKGGIEIAMAHSTSTELAKELDIAVTMNDGSLTEGAITITFGGHVLTTPFLAKVE
ncbi:MAG: tetratricopeptide repeat protein [Planctomycetes bacterium]|nr:tetratricopeptide repeat protein [Planctomycetota bacterium]